jgi:hypothetical protein
LATLRKQRFHKLLIAAKVKHPFSLPGLFLFPGSENPPRNGGSGGNMNRQFLESGVRSLRLFLLLAAWPVAGLAQVAVPEVEEINELPVISAAEIEELVGPIALYPDDLLAIVLPASTYPLQIVEAGRFLEDLEDDSSLEPDPDWDDSIVALLNYPEVVAMLNEDLDWTWRLGEAVVSQQSDVIAAIEGFRDRAYAAGNLKSDDYQLVAEEEGTISITPVQEDVIYVPYYEPEEVVVYQPRPVYYYYPRAYPVYYYPYPSWYAFHDHFYRPWFWGVTTAFSIGWHTHHLSVYHHSFYGHPYYGRTYWDRWWYRRPDITVYNNVYVRNTHYTNVNRYRDGDRWLPRTRRTVDTNQRITRSHHYPNSRSGRPATSTSYTNTNRAGQVAHNTRMTGVDRSSISRSEHEPIEFRKRPSSTIAPSSRNNAASIAAPRSTNSRSTTARPSGERSAKLLERDVRDTTVRTAKSRVTTTRRATSTVTSGPAPRQPAARPSTPSRQPASRPSSPRQSTARESSSRQSAARPSSSPRNSASSSSRRDQSNKRRSKK